MCEFPKLIETWYTKKSSQGVLNYLQTLYRIQTNCLKLVIKENSIVPSHAYIIFISLQITHIHTLTENIICVIVKSKHPTFCPQHHCIIDREWCIFKEKKKKILYRGQSFFLCIQCCFVFFFFSPQFKRKSHLLCQHTFTTQFLFTLKLVVRSDMILGYCSLI